MAAFIDALFARLPGALRHAPRQVIHHLGLVARHLVISVLQQLVFAVQQRLANALLHARIVQLALPGRVFGDDFENAVTLLRLDDGADGAGGQRHHHLTQLDVGFLQGGLGNEAQIAAIGSRLRVFGVAVCHQAELFTALQALLNFADLAGGLGIVLRLTVFQVACARLRIGRHQNLRHVHARLRQIEAGLVGMVEGGDIRVGTDDVRGDVLVDELLNAQLAAYLGFQIVQRHLVVAKLLLELLLGPGSLQLGELSFDVRIARQQALLFGALQHDLAIDQAAQYLQFLRHGLLLGLAGRGELRLLIGSLKLGIRDGATVDRSGYVGGRRFVAGRGAQEREESGHTSPADRAHWRPARQSIKHDDASLYPGTMACGRDPYESGHDRYGGHFAQARGGLPEYRL